jgi:NTE family protein
MGSGGLIEALGPDAWTALRAHMERRSYVPGETLIEHGTLEPDLHVIEEGTASVLASSRERRRELGTIGPGEAIGDMSLLTGEPASADVVAATPVRAWAISQQRLASLDDVRTRLIEAMATMLAARLRYANQRLVAEHRATVHAVRCAPSDIPAVARLPHALALVVDAPVLAVLAGDAFRDVAPETFAAPDVNAWCIADAEVDDLPLRIKRAEHEYERVLVFAASEPALRAVDAASVHAVAAEDAAPPRDGLPLIVVSRMSWTPPGLRALAERLGVTVSGVVPPAGSTTSLRPLLKLARFLAGKQVGIALGAGAAKGFAHLGVMRAFDDLALDVDAIAGCSIGSAIAAGWAAGYRHAELQSIVLQVANRAVRPTLPLHSFLSNRGIRDELEKVGRGRRFEDLDIPLAICATDIYRRCEVTFTTGLVWPRILASMAIPGIYPALKGPDSYLVDGGVLNPVPSRQCRELGAGVVIAARLTGERTSPRQELDFLPGRPLATETIMRCLEIMHNRLSELSRSDADVTIEIKLEKGGIRDFDRASDIADAGYAATMAAKDDILAALPWLREAKA